MPNLLSLVSSYWKIGLGVLLMFAGWHGHTIYDGYREKKEVAEEVVTARDGEVAIIKFHGDYAKEKALVKNDKCIDAPIPAGIRGLLNGK